MFALSKRVKNWHTRRADMQTSRHALPVQTFNQILQSTEAFVYNGFFAVRARRLTNVFVFYFMGRPTMAFSVQRDVVHRLQCEEQGSVPGIPSTSDRRLVEQTVYDTCTSLTTWTSTECLKDEYFVTFDYLTSVFFRSMQFYGNGTYPEIIDIIGEGYSICLYKSVHGYSQK